MNHFNDQGQAWMVNIGHKPHTSRRAVASGKITMQAATLARVQSGSMGKGDVLGIARIAAIMATKRCADLIPLCHPIALTHSSIDFTSDDTGILISATCSTTGPTGVEMEALTAVSIGLLTIYDMCKAIDKTMSIQDVKLLQKTGGQSSET